MIRGDNNIPSLYQFLVCLIALTFCSAQSMAADLSDTRPLAFSLEAGDLGQCLKQFSAQTGISLVYDDRLVAGRQVTAVSGALTPRAALDAILAKTPLEYREIDRGMLAIIERPGFIEAEPENDPVELISKNENPRVDEIIVTASYRAPVAYGALKVDYSLDAEALELSGAQNVSEPILELPTTVASVSAANTQLLISASGLNLTDLRGLEPSRSLVLINGRRFVRTSGGNGNIYGVDLNSVPTALVERVEVINQGAGPILGTDAVAGAVNIVLRDHIDGGISISADGGISERGDAGEYSFSVFTGTAFGDDRGKVSGGVVYASDPSLFFTDRDYLTQPPGFASNGRQSSPGNGVLTPGFGGSITTPAGSVVGAIGTAGDTVLFPSRFDRVILGPNGFDSFEGRLDQLYNWVDGFSALPEIERLHGYAKSDFKITPRIDIYGEFFFSDVSTRSQIAPAPIAAFRGHSPRFGDAIAVPADHPLAPAGLRGFVETSVGGSIESFLITRRFVELGPRANEIDRQTLQFSSGLTFDVNDTWSVTADYLYGRNRSEDVSIGAPDGARVAIAANPTLCAATPGCVPFNIFSGDVVPQDVAAFFRQGGSVRRIKTSEHVLRIAAAGPIYKLEDRNGGVSFGAEFRRDSLKDSGTDASIIRLGEFDAPGGSGSVSYGELFAGADLPIAGENGPVGAIEFGIDGRLTRWSGNNYVGNVSGDISWRPYPALEFYAFVVNGGRVPNVVELSSEGLNIAEILFDPCADLTSQRIIDNCATVGPLGVPSGFLQENPLVLSLTSGNPDLDHEKIHSRHFGVAIDIEEIVNIGDQALRFTADWRFHRVEDQITEFRSSDAVFDCYDSIALSSQFCGINPATGNRFIQRDLVTGQLNTVETTNLNGGQARTSGLDATMAYRNELYWLPLAPEISVDVLYSYIDRLEYREIFGDQFIDQAGLASFPQHQLYATATLETGAFKTLWTIRRRGEAQTITELDIPETRLPATTYVDAGIQFRPDDSLILYAGIENLFDKELPVALFGERGFFAEFYNPVGRRYFAGIKAEF